MRNAPNPNDYDSMPDYMFALGEWMFKCQTFNADKIEPKPSERVLETAPVPDEVVYNLTAKECVAILMDEPHAHFVRLGGFPDITWRSLDSVDVWQAAHRDQSRFRRVK